MAVKLFEAKNKLTGKLIDNVNRELKNKDMYLDIEDGQELIDAIDDGTLDFGSDNNTVKTYAWTILHAVYESELTGKEIDQYIEDMEKLPVLDQIRRNSDWKDLANEGDITDSDFGSGRSLKNFLDNIDVINTVWQSKLAGEDVLGF